MNRLSQTVEVEPIHQLHGRVVPHQEPRRQHPDRLQEMLVDGVVVIHAELHHGHDPPEIGDEAAEHAGLVHPPQHDLGRAAGGQDLEEEPVGLRVGPHLLADQLERFRQRPPGFPLVQLGLLAGREAKVDVGDMVVLPEPAVDLPFHDDRARGPGIVLDGQRDVHALSSIADKLHPAGRRRFAPEQPQPVGHARFLNGYYRERGVDVRAQTTVASVRKSGDKVALSVTGPDGSSETIRADAVNVLNRPIWRNPNTDINSATFGAEAVK